VTVNGTTTLLITIAPFSVALCESFKLARGVNLQAYHVGAELPVVAG